MAVPLERLAALARHFPADAEISHHRRRPRGNGHLRQVRVQAAGVSDRRLCRRGMRSARKPAASSLMPRSRATCLPDRRLRPRTDDSRPYLNGIFLHNAGDNLVAVATDGFRLCRVTAPATTDALDGSVADHPERDGENHRSPARQCVRQRDAAPIRTAVLGRGHGIRARHHADRCDLSRL